MLHGFCERFINTLNKIAYHQSQDELIAEINNILRKLRQNRWRKLQRF